MIYIITGHYGSGKTEFAVNLAKKLKNPVIADMDIVNPYFRTADVKEKLEAEGIKVITPEFANTNVDVPSLPPDIIGALQGDRDVVLDVGGDEDGAVVLGQYKKYFSDNYEMLLVMNFCRPMTATPEELLEVLYAIEQVSRVKITGLINNTNVKSETTAEIINKSMENAEAVSEMTGIPLAGVSAAGELINKVDTIKKEEILPVIDCYRKELDFQEIIPVSARSGANVDELIDTIYKYLPYGPMFYDEDTITDQPMRQIVAELIREKALHALNEEIPHGIAVVIDSMKERKSQKGIITDIQATIICERDSHKGIIIGKGGEMLKKIGANARYEIEKQLDTKVNLQLWVKVKKEWRDSDVLIKNFGYDKKKDDLG